MQIAVIVSGKACNIDARIAVGYVSHVDDPLGSKQRSAALELLPVGETGVANSKGGQGGGGSPGLHKAYLGAEGWGYRPERFTYLDGARATPLVPGHHTAALLHRTR